MNVRASFSNVISVVALIVALSGSTAAATIASSSPVNSSDLRFGGHESETKVVIKPSQQGSAAVDSIHFTAPRRSSALINGGFTVTNNSSETVTVSLIVGMNSMSEKYTIDQTVQAGATEQLTVAGLKCNGIPAGKNVVTFAALASNLADGNVTFGFRTVDITEWNLRKLSLGR